jgi:LysR family hydrogen peroxide-inducible transcriptional activator
MSALPSLRQLRYLIAVSEKLNFTQAAESCFVTQSTLSAGIKELEATIGAHLVERERHSVVMTPIGIEVVAACARGCWPKPKIWRMGAQRRAADERPAKARRHPDDRALRTADGTAGPAERYPELKLALREDLTAICWPV